MNDLSGKRVAMLVEQEFEDRELTGPLEALRGAGATVVLVGPTALAESTGKRGEARVASEIAAGLYVDKPVVVDGNLITSRKPDDVPVFSDAIIRALAPGESNRRQR